MILFVWLVLLTAPVLFREEEYFNWESVLKSLNTLLPLFVIFLINRFVLVPQLLFKRRRILYIISIASLIAAMTIASFVYHINKPDNQARPGIGMEGPHMEEFRRPPPEMLNNDRRQPPPNPRGTRPMPPFVNLLIFSLLMVGFDTGLKASFRWAETEKEKAKLEKENVVNQLDMLRNQVNPHFFMNTLNNIHTLIDMSSDKAKDAVVKLSKMMRYLLYDTAHGSTTLKKEVEFIESYIDLMKLRVSDKVSIALTLPGLIPDKTIPPLLFTSFIENAFKYGISYQSTSFIHIDLLLDEERLLFQIKNSNHHIKQEEGASGIGLENARKRLELLYANNYHLDIIDGGDVFSINLSIPLI